MSEGAKKTIRVVAGEIRNESGQYLITQRLPHAAMPLLWEFPGGKVEPGETDAQALIREIHEELDLDIDVVGSSFSAEHDYGAYCIDFHSLQAVVRAGSPLRIGVWDFRWVEPADLALYPFPPADRETIQRLLNLQPTATARPK